MYRWTYTCFLWIVTEFTFCFAREISFKQPFIGSSISITNRSESIADVLNPINEYRNTLRWDGGKQKLPSWKVAWSVLVLIIPMLVISMEHADFCQTASEFFYGGRKYERLCASCSRLFSMRWNWILHSEGREVRAVVLFSDFSCTCFSTQRSSEGVEAFDERSNHFEHTVTKLVTCIHAFHPRKWDAENPVWKRTTLVALSFLSPPSPEWDACSWLRTLFPGSFLWPAHSLRIRFFSLRWKHTMASYHTSSREEFKILPNLSNGTDLSSLTPDHSQWILLLLLNLSSTVEQQSVCE